MWNWLRGAAPKKNEPRDAILGSTAKPEGLSKEGRSLKIQIDEQDKLARKLLNTSRYEAKVALSWKKEYEHALECTLIQILRLEDRIYRTEAANNDQETFDTMKQASTTIIRMHGEFWPDRVEEVTYVYLSPLSPHNEGCLLTMVYKENLRDKQLLNEEVHKLIRPWTGYEVYDDEKLEAELGALQQE